MSSVEDREWGRNFLNSQRQQVPDPNPISAQESLAEHAAKISPTQNLKFRHLPSG